MEALYRQAGLSLDHDLDTLAAAPRVAADPKAIVYMAPQVFDGALKDPVIAMGATGDQIAPVAGEEAYMRAAARAAGHGAMLRARSSPTRRAIARSRQLKSPRWSTP